MDDFICCKCGKHGDFYKRITFSVIEDGMIISDKFSICDECYETLRSECNQRGSGVEYSAESFRETIGGEK